MGVLSQKTPYRLCSCKFNRQIFPLSHTLHHLLISITHLTNRSHYSSLPSRNLETVNNLISIFTNQEKNPSFSEELTKFGSNLTTDVVEITLKSFKNWETALRFFNWSSNQNGYHHNCYTYNAMASILSGVRQNAAVKKLFADLVNSRCYVSPGALGFSVRCLGSLGMVNEANDLFDQVKNLGCVPNDYSYNSLLETISKSGSIDLMAMRMNEMKDNGWKPDKYTLTSVLQCYCTAGKFEKALQVFNQIVELGWVDSYIFTIIIISLNKSGDVDNAIRLINKMDDFKINLNEKTFYVLIHGFVKNGKIDYALTLLKKMQTLGFVPGISLYAVLIEGLCKKQDFAKALQLYSQMNETGIHPDVNVIKVLLLCLSDEKEMISILNEAKNHVNKKSMATLYNSALYNLVKHGSTDKAYGLIRSIMKDTNLVSVETESFEIVINDLCQKGELDKALDLFNDMDLIGCKRSLLLYNNLINAFSDAKKVEKCHELLNEMKKHGFTPSNFTHNSIFGYYCKIGDFNGARNMLHELRAHGHQPWIKHYTFLVKKLSVNRKMAEASNFLIMMVELGFNPDIIVYSAVIDGWLKIEEVDYALKMFKDISVNGRFPDVVTYNTIINGLCKAKRVSEAREIYNDMVQKSLVPSVVTYNLLIDAYCKNNDVDQAVDFFSMMSEKNRNPNVVTYTSLIDGLCNVGRSDEASIIWEKMVCNCKPNEISYMVMINGLCKCGKPDLGLTYFAEMEEKHMKADTYVYVMLIDAFICVSNAPSGFSIFRKMIRDERLPNLGDKNCVILREIVVKLLNDVRTCDEMRMIIADGSVPIYLLQTSGS